MKKFITVLIMALISMPLSALDIMNLETGSRAAGSSAELPVRMVQSDENGVTVTYQFSFAELSGDPLYPECTLFRIPGFSLVDEPGKPSVPIRTDIIGIPSNKTAKITITDTRYREYPIKVAPARPVLSDDNYETYTLNNVPPVNYYSGYFPDMVANRDADYVYRGTNLMAIKICPLRYSVSNGIARVYTTIQYRIDFIDSNNTDQIAAVSRPFISITDHTLVNNVINAEATPIGNAPNEDTEGLLIVTTTPLMKAAQIFAEWKKTMGYKTEILCRDNWTASEVLTQVRQTYNTHPELYSVILLGDHTNVPAQLSKTFKEHLTDFNYGCMTEGQYIMPDLHRGRISVSNPMEAENVVRKIIYYESVRQNDANFYKTGLHCAYFQDKDHNGYADRRFAQTAEEILDFMSKKGFDMERVYTTPENVTPLFWNNTLYSNGESIPEHLKKPRFKWNGNSADITRAINKGVSYILHRDHGDITEWSDPQYTVADIKSLCNSGNLPIVFSLNCLTGTLGHSSESFSEAFLRHSNGGCAGIIAATGKSLSGYNDEFAIEMFNAMYPYEPMNPQFKNPLSNPSIGGGRPLYKLGEIMDQGLARIGNRYGDRTHLKAQYTRELFHCFGDPTMMVYLERPKTFSDIHISRSNSVSVNLPEGKIARISFYDKTKNDVLSFIGNYAAYSTADPENVIVSVTADGHLPYLDYGENNVDYIQNETVVGMRSYTSGTIKVGNNVTKNKTPGDVVFKNGTVVLKAKNVELNSGTTIEVGTDFSITTY